MRESLAQIFERHAVYGVDAGHGDKGSTHSYIEAYETLLAPYRNRCDFMEIGMASGYSMQMWGEYFGMDCTIVGVDVSIIFDTTPFDFRFNFIKADATTPFCTHYSDVVIDDGSHMEADQIATFNMLKPLMRKGGIYVIEDIICPEISVPHLTALHDRVEVLDFRTRKGRFDDMLIVYRF